MKLQFLNDQLNNYNLYNILFNIATHLEALWEFIQNLYSIELRPRMRSNKNWFEKNTYNSEKTDRVSEKIISVR